MTFSSLGRGVTRCSRQGFTGAATGYACFGHESSMRAVVRASIRD